MQPVVDPLSLAVGVLMHRHSLSRHDALLRLQRVADDEGRGLAEQAARLVDAVEMLAKSGAT